MTNRRVLLALTACLTIVSFPAFAQDAKSPAAPPTGTNAPSSDAKKPTAPSQSDLASKTAAFEKLSKTNATYTAALDAHDLDAALKQADKEGAFKGTAAKIYEPRGGAMDIINFDADYKTAMTALLRKDNFDKFPDLKTLVGKDVLVSGTFIEYQGRAEVILTNAAQIKLVE